MHVFIEAPLPSEGSVQSCKVMLMCVRGIDFSSMCTIFGYDFGNVPTWYYFSRFILLETQNRLFYFLTVPIMCYYYYYCLEGGGR